MILSSLRNHSFVIQLRTITGFISVHSYHFKLKNKDNILTESEYGYKYPSGFIKDNIIGLQFHPEKSHKYGMKILREFSNINYEKI